VSSSSCACVCPGGGWLGSGEAIECIRYTSFFDVTLKDTSPTNKKPSQTLCPHRINTQRMDFFSKKTMFGPKLDSKSRQIFHSCYQSKLNVRGFGVPWHSTGSSGIKHGWSRLSCFLVNGSSSQDNSHRGSLQQCSDWLGSADVCCVICDM